jgi:hypothetical protein
VQSTGTFELKFLEVFDKEMKDVQWSANETTTLTVNRKIGT